NCEPGAACDWARSFCADALHARCAAWRESGDVYCRDATGTQKRSAEYDACDIGCDLAIDDAIDGSLGAVKVFGNLTPAVTLTGRLVTNEGNRHTLASATQGGRQRTRVERWHKLWPLSENAGACLVSEAESNGR